MREILFKAKRIDNGEWFEGVPVDVTPLQCFAEPQSKECVMVCAGFADWGMPRGIEYAKVDPVTVCQYTGLTDKNSMKIFEGDILLDRSGYTGTVEYGDFNCGCCYDVFGYTVSDLLEFNHGYKEAETCCDLEVIGNIHDKEA